MMAKKAKNRNLKISSVGTFIKKKRLDAGLPQKIVADHLGVHTQSISNFERGIAPVPFKHIAALGALLNFSTSVVIEFLVKEYRVYLQKNIK